MQCRSAQDSAHLGDGEGSAAVGVVHRHVQARTEEVLVHLRIEARRQEGAVSGLGALPRAQAVGAEAARQLHLVLDCAILQAASPHSGTSAQGSLCIPWWPHPSTLVLRIPDGL